MKRIIAIIICSLSAYIPYAQSTLNSTQAATSNLNPPASAQPVPNATVTEKSAATAKPLIAPAANPVPPIYPGGDVRAVETNNNLIFPASPPSPTQPIQREPLTPVESKNVLQPTRPQREENSRVNTATGVQVQTGYIAPVNNRPVTRTSGVKPVTRATTTTSPATVTTTTTTTSSKDNIAMKMDGSVRTTPADRVGTTGKTKKGATGRSQGTKTSTYKKP
ncbi:MAG: hypothetical protein WKF88_06800 [Ferruginibacter sp.]